VIIQLTEVGCVNYIGVGMKARLAFYKGEGDITDKAIRWWTKSPYSHVELVIGDNKWISVSPRIGNLTSRYMLPNKEHWDYLPIEVDEGRLDMLLDKYLGCKYDWLGIALTQFIPMNVQDPKKLFCSEWCAMVLGLDKPSKYSPGSLYNKLRK